MKKNKFLYSLIVIFGFQILASCDKDFLELKPRGQFLEDAFYINEEQVFQGLVAAYDPLGYGADWGMKIAIMTIGSDEAYKGGSDASDQQQLLYFDNYTLTPTSGPQRSLWRRNYVGIYRTNLLLRKIEGATMDATVKSRIIAEAKFLRAFYYFDLVREFGGVPLILDELSSSELYSQKRASKEEVYLQIEKDLSEAIKDLPVSVNGSEKGRITWGAAKALLGKVYLYEEKFSQAAAELNKVNTSGLYELLPNFGDVFYPGNKYHKESIFEITHASNDPRGWDAFGATEGNYNNQLMSPRDWDGPMLAPGYGFAPISLDLVDALQGDPRYGHTIINTDSLRDAGYAKYSDSYQRTGYFGKKYTTLAEFKCTCNDYYLNWSQNEIEIRLADTYLMEAEALVRGGGDIGRAKTLLNLVRGRVKLGEVEPTLENIYNERRLELALEGHRFFDLVRTGKAAETLGTLGFTKNKNEVFPIPQSEIDVTNGSLKQNPNY